MLQVKVAATSANVCVGFDVLGLALDLYNTFYFEKSDRFEFSGFKDEFSSEETNLVCQAYKFFFENIKEAPIPVRIGFGGDIPVSRGLGSSSSLIVAGIFAANKISGKNKTKRYCFDLCAKMEGHPDNVAPAIYGDLIASYKTDNGYKHEKYSINKDLKFITIIPSYELKTEDARKVLPKELDYKSINVNLSRIINLPRAFYSGNVEKLIDLFHDTLHEPYRGKLIKDYNDVKELANKYNLAFAISGSGSTMIAIYNEKTNEEKDIANFKNGLEKLGLEYKELKVGKKVEIKNM